MNTKKINKTKEQSKKWYSSIFYNIDRWFRYTWVVDFLYSVKAGVPSLFKWTKIAWEDRDWDNYFIYKTLRFKINNTLKHINKNKIHSDYKQIVFWMRICVNLIDKIIDDKYEMEFLDYEETEFRFKKIGDSEVSEIHIDIIEDNLDEYINKYPTWHRKAIKYINKNKSKYDSDHNDKTLQSMIIGRLRQDKARKLLFKILYRKIDSWWD